MASRAPNKDLNKDRKGADKATKGVGDICRGVSDLAVEHDTDEEESGGSTVDSVEVTEENLCAELKKICGPRFMKKFQGHIESVYKNALIIKLKKRGIEVESEVSIPKEYYRQVVGTRKADVILTLKSKSKVILELKAVQTLALEHYHQLFCYMELLNIQRGFLINFPPCGKFPPVNLDHFNVVGGEDIVKKMKDAAESLVLKPAEIKEVYYSGE